METKPGIYTTEFWITVLTALGMLLAGAEDWIPAKYAGFAIAASAAAYTIARGLAKQGVAADPSVPANAKLFPRRKDMHPKR